MRHLTLDQPWANFHYLQSAIDLFGFLSYGIDINAYVVNEDGSISIWLQRRALTKFIDPGKLDSFVSSAGHVT